MQPGPCTAPSHLPAGAPGWGRHHQTSTRPYKPLDTLILVRAQTPRVNPSARHPGKALDTPLLHSLQETTCEYQQPGSDIWADQILVQPRTLSLGQGAGILGGLKHPTSGEAWDSTLLSSGSPEKTACEHQPPLSKNSPKTPSHSVHTGDQAGEQDIQPQGKARDNPPLCSEETVCKHLPPGLRSTRTRPATPLTSEPGWKHGT